jgi:omega-hydroxy-beta-dihydromenaquinone-9 sulfotransferase
MNSIFSRYLKIVSVVRKAHGVYVVPWILGWAFLNIRLIVWVGMALDNVFFPKLRQTKVERPIILVGNPRTGTTFLQRFLSDNGFGSGMQLFMSLYPSLTLQKVLSPFLPILEKLSPTHFHNADVHDTSLTQVETDDVTGTLRFLDGFFLYGFFVSWDEVDQRDQFDPKIRNTNDRDFAWLEKVWARSMVNYGVDRNVAKLFSVGPRLPEFLEYFPKAQILYTVRDPVDVIPSTMSLVTGVLDRAFGFWAKPEAERQQWIDRLYAGLLMLLERFHEDWVNGRIDRDRVYVVRYDRMMKDFDGMMGEMCEFLGHEMSDELRATVAAKADKQRAYKSKHKYDLAKFGLSEEKIRKDCAFVYETFLPPMDFGKGKADEAVA